MQKTNLPVQLKTGELTYGINFSKCLKLSSTEYIIRPCQARDLESISELYTLFWGDIMNLEKMAQKFSELSGNSHYILLCAESNGNVIGTLQGIICEELYGECRPFLVMENFIVHKDYRGKGIGRALLKALEEIGREKQCTQIIFITETERKDSIEFYRKAGYNAQSHQGFKKSLK